jgi:anti-sigma regulatory factor (Ser/Thr protein kinase)
MGQLRTALNAYAIQGHGPATTLGLVDRFVHAMGGDAMATAAYAVLDPETGDVEYASAGHLPPIVTGGARARTLAIEPAPPLGSFAYIRIEQHHMLLAPGETLVLYTDGLIERPGCPLDTSIEDLLGLMSGATSAESACVLAVEQFVPPEGLRDDVAIVAVENSPIPEQLRLRLPAVATVLAPLRRGVRRWLRSRGAREPDLTEIAMALNEACANAIEHAYSPSPAEFSLEATVEDWVVTIVVTDQGRLREPRGQGRGRGLIMVRAAMDEVEVTSGESGTTVLMRRKLGPR